MVSVEQLNALISFMENHHEMALGHCSRSKEGRSQMRRLWAECADILNSISHDCVSKTADQWRLYFNEYKSKLVKKIKLEKAQKTATGGGPPKKVILTPIQERLYSILGRDVGDPLPGVRHNPLSQQSEESEQEGMERVWEMMVVHDDPELTTTEEVGFEAQQSQPWLLSELQQPSQPRLSSEPQQPSQPRLSSEPQQPSQPRLLSEPEPEQAPPTSTAPRRSRQPRSRRRVDTDSALQEAQDTLIAAENISSEALRQHALAIDRHAAAIDRLAAAMESIAAVLANERPYSTRRYQRIIESDSE